MIGGVGATEGISPAAGVAEGAVGNAAGTAARAAEAGVKTAETAGGVMPSASEALPGAVDEGTELAAQNDLATGAENTLNTSGPGAALQEIASGDASASSPDASPNVTDSGMDQRAIDAVNARIAESKARGQEVSLEERHKMYEEELAKLNASSETGDQAPGAQPEQTVTQADSDISDETRNDPLFQQKLEEERTAAGERGEVVDDQELSRRALDRFNQDKQVEQSLQTPEQQRIQQLEERIQALTEQNEQLLEKINELGKSMQELGEWAKGHEQDPKKKESLLVLLAKIAAIVVIGAVVEGGGKVIPSLPSQQG